MVILAPFCMQILFEFFMEDFSTFLYANFNWVIFGSFSTFLYANEISLNFWRFLRNCTKKSGKIRANFKSLVIFCKNKCRLLGFLRTFMYTVLCLNIILLENCGPFCTLRQLCKCAFYQPLTQRSVSPNTDVWIWVRYNSYEIRPF